MTNVSNLAENDRGDLTVVQPTFRVLHLVNNAPREDKYKHNNGVYAQPVIRGIGSKLLEGSIEQKTVAHSGPGTEFDYREVVP